MNDRTSNAQERWIGVGRSAEHDPRAAAREAVSDAVSGDQPKLLIVFCSSCYETRALLAEINDSQRDVAVIGCSTAGEIATSGPGQASVVVTALGGPGEAEAAADLVTAELP